MDLSSYTFWLWRLLKYRPELSWLSSLRVLPEKGWTEGATFSAQLYCLGSIQNQSSESPPWTVRCHRSHFLPPSPRQSTPKRIVLQFLLVCFPVTVKALQNGAPLRLFGKHGGQQNDNSPVFTHIETVGLEVEPLKLQRVAHLSRQLSYIDFVPRKSFQR